MTSQTQVCAVVIASFSEDGDLLPGCFRWGDGRDYSIEKVLDVRQAAAMKAGDQSDRKTVQINRHQSYLFLREVQTSGGKP